jgi:hypothetical protein
VSTAFKPGNSVVIKGRLRNPATGVNFAGWQGRVIAVGGIPVQGTQVEVHWGSLTLQALPYRYLRRCSLSDVPWEVGFVPPSRIEIVPERDTLSDVKRALQSTHQRYRWVDEFGRSGERIFQVIGGEQLDSTVHLAWQKHLAASLRFPFSASVDYLDEIDDPDLLRDYCWLVEFDQVQVLRLTEYDGAFGIIAEIQYDGSRFEFPLCNLDAPWLHRNRKHLEDYRIWFVSQ